MINLHYEESLQPGTHIRRVNGRELTDEEMIEYYSNLAGEHGDRLLGRYRNAIYFIVDDSLSIDSDSGKYYYDLPEKSVDQSAIEQGFRAFFEAVLGSR